MSAVDAIRRLASAVWRRERRLDDLYLGGFNSEYAVRRRLSRLGGQLAQVDAVPSAALARLARMRFGCNNPFAILEGTEALLELLCPRPVQDGAHLIRSNEPGLALAAELLLVQCLAARLGWWVPRGEEVEDAQLAQRCYCGVQVPQWARFRKLIERAQQEYDRGAHEEAARSVFHADRLVRTPRGLLLAVEALRGIGQVNAALWACRACLLEPLAAFSSQAQYLRVEALQARLSEQQELLRPPTVDADELALLAEAFSFEELEAPWGEAPAAPAGLRLDSQQHIVLDPDLRQTIDAAPRLISETFDIAFAMEPLERPTSVTEPLFVGLRAATTTEAKPVMSPHTLEILLGRAQDVGTFERPDFDQLTTRFTRRALRRTYEVTRVQRPRGRATSFGRASPWARSGS